MAVRPDMTLEVAFASDPNSSAPTYEDISAHWTAFEVSRGKEQELDRQEAGTARVTLQSTDRRFEKDYAGGIVNLWTNPSFETNTTGYTATGGATLTRSAVAGFFGDYVLKIDAANAANSGFYTSVIAATAGTTYVVSLTGVTGSGTKAMKFVFDWYDSGFGLLSSDTSSTKNYNSTTMRRLSASAGAPANTAYVVIQFLTESAQGVFDIYVDGLQVEAGFLSDYVDGDQDNCRWAGTAHASQSYRGGPYYPNVVPRKKLRISGTWNSTQDRIFTGYVESWPTQWPMAGRRAELDVTAIDGFAVLAKKKVNTTFAQERTDERIWNVLNEAHWPTTERNISVGITVVQAATVQDESALAHLQRCQEAEDGRVFVAADGKVTFFDRWTPYMSPYDVASSTFGDIGTTAEWPYVGITIENGDRLIYNDIRLQREGSTNLITSSDAQSVSAYWENSLQRTDLLTLDENEIAQQASALKDRYKDPALRITSLLIDPYQQPDQLWPFVLGVELGDRIRVKRRPYNASNPTTDSSNGLLSQDCFVEGIRHAADRDGRWETELKLTAIGVNYNPGPFLILDNASSKLDSSGCRLAY